MPAVAALPRMGALAAAAGFVALAWVAAERASEHAVLAAAAAFSPSTDRITLPSVMIVARRDDLVNEGKRE